MPHLARRIVLSASALAGLVASGPALAVDFVRETVPHKWIERFVPEDLPEQKYPAYFNDFDKAKFQSFTGRYKLSLITLRKYKDPKPEELVPIALVRAESLSALGRWQQATEALSEPAVADKPEIRVRKAKVLADSGKPSEAKTLLEQIVRDVPGSIDAHYLLGVVSERLGDLDSARKAYGWFVEDPQSYLEKWQS